MNFPSRSRRSTRGSLLPTPGHLGRRRLRHFGLFSLGAASSGGGHGQGMLFQPWLPNPLSRTPRE